MILRKILILTCLTFAVLPTTLAQQPIRLIVRADDMGYSHDIGLAIVQAHQRGIVTSASLMPGSPFFEEAVKLCRDNPKLAIGVHLTVLGGRLRPVLPPDMVPSLVNNQGFFYDTVDDLVKANPDPSEIEMEFRAQIDKVKAAGIRFVYLDWHMNPPASVQELVKNLCVEMNLVFAQDYTGSSHGYVRMNHDIENWPSQTMPDGQLAYYDITPLPEANKKMYYDLLNGMGPGTWLLVIHPGLAGKERAGVTELLCSQMTREIVGNRQIQVISYADLWEERFGEGRP